MRLLLSLLLGGALAATLISCSGSPDRPAATSAAAPTYSPPPKPSSISIPKLGVTSNIIDLGLQPNGEMEVPPDAKDVGWFTSSPLPGQVGPAVLAAHVNWKGTDGPFAKLDQLAPGDEVTVESVDGAKATFVIDKVETHSKDAFPAEAVYGDVERPEIRLVTCGGAFDPAAHSYESNVIAWGHLKG